MEYIPGPEQVLALWQTEQVGEPSELKCRGATPGSHIAIFAASGPDGSFLLPPGFPCAGTRLDLNPTNIRLVTIATADAAGEVTLGPMVLPPLAQWNLRLQALDMQTCTTSNRMLVVF